MDLLDPGNASYQSTPNRVMMRRRLRTRRRREDGILVLPVKAFVEDLISGKIV
jgi:hypothetical protein